MPFVPLINTTGDLQRDVLDDHEQSRFFRSLCDASMPVVVVFVCSNLVRFRRFAFLVTWCQLEMAFCFFKQQGVTLKHMCAELSCYQVQLTQSASANPIVFEAVN